MIKLRHLKIGCARARVSGVGDLLRDGAYFDRHFKFGGRVF